MMYYVKKRFCTKPGNFNSIDDQYEILFKTEDYKEVYRWK